MKRLRDHFSGVKCMKKLFRAQGYVVENPPPAPPDEANFSVESRYSDEDSEIKNILGSGQRDSRYVIKSDEESPRKSKCRKIPVLDTSESEFEESELSRAGFSNVAFDEKE